MLEGLGMSDWQAIRDYKYLNHTTFNTGLGYTQSAPMEQAA